MRTLVSHRPSPVTTRAKPRVLLTGPKGTETDKLIEALLGRSEATVRILRDTGLPIWFVNADVEPMRQDYHGEVHTIDDPEHLDVARTRFFIVGCKTAILEHIDLLYFPSGYDVSFVSEAWEVLVDYADSILWCTEFARPWRQNEQLVWRDIPQRLKKTSAVLLTHHAALPNRETVMSSTAILRRRAGNEFLSFLAASIQQPSDITAVRDYLIALSGGWDGAIDDEDKNQPGQRTSAGRVSRSASRPRPLRKSKAPAAHRSVRPGLKRVAWSPSRTAGQDSHKAANSNSQSVTRRYQPPIIEDRGDFAADQRACVSSEEVAVPRQPSRYVGRMVLPQAAPLTIAPGVLTKGDERMLRVQAILTRMTETPAVPHIANTNLAVAARDEDDCPLAGVCRHSRDA
ncbi:MAG: hypothetical protein QNJ13_18240 [Paracoccaceae bacterium]|nr:hypothetical protein [Paracoccaceae bacterium]